MKIVRTVLNNKEIGKAFKQDQKAVKEYFEEASEEDKLRLMKEMEEKGEINIKTENGKEFKLPKGFVSFEVQEKTIQEEKYTPSVIEPSFGKKHFIIRNFRYWKNCLLYFRTLFQAKRGRCPKNLLHFPSSDCSSEVLYLAFDGQTRP